MRPAVCRIAKPHAIDGKVGPDFYLAKRLRRHARPEWLAHLIPLITPAGRPAQPRTVVGGHGGIKGSIGVAINLGLRHEIQGRGKFRHIEVWPGYVIVEECGDHSSVELKDGSKGLNYL